MTTKTPTNNRIARDAFLLCESLEFARRELTLARKTGYSILNEMAEGERWPDPVAEANAQIEREQLLEEAFIQYKTALTRLGWELRHCSML